MAANLQGSVQFHPPINDADSLLEFTIGASTPGVSDQTWIRACGRRRAFSYCHS